MAETTPLLNPVLLINKFQQIGLEPVDPTTIKPGSIVYILKGYQPGIVPSAEIIGYGWGDEKADNQINTPTLGHTHYLLHEGEGEPKELKTFLPTVKELFKSNNLHIKKPDNTNFHLAIHPKRAIVSYHPDYLNTPESKTYTVHYTN